MKNTLLVSHSYEFLNFISERKLYKLLFVGKIEIISTWNDKIEWMGEEINLPSIVKLTHPIKRYFNTALLNCNRPNLIKRDNSQCQYCAKFLSRADTTIDHVLPKSRGGKTSFLNCVIACKTCNNIKDNKTPEEAKMKLLNKPSMPTFNKKQSYKDGSMHWFDEWDDYIRH